MINEQLFTSKAKEASGQEIRISCSARYKADENKFGLDGLLCFTDDKLVFVEDQLLSPGDIFIVELYHITEHEITNDIIHASIRLQTEQKSYYFVDIALDQAKKIQAYLKDPQAKANMQPDQVLASSKDSQLRAQPEQPQTTTSDASDKTALDTPAYDPKNPAKTLLDDLLPSGNEHESSAAKDEQAELPDKTEQHQAYEPNDGESSPDYGLNAFAEQAELPDKTEQHQAYEPNGGESGSDYGLNASAEQTELPDKTEQHPAYAADHSESRPDYGFDAPTEQARPNEAEASGEADGATGQEQVFFQRDQQTSSSLAPPFQVDSEDSKQAIFDEILLSDENVEAQKSPEELIELARHNPKTVIKNAQNVSKDVVIPLADQPKEIEQVPKSEQGKSLKPLHTKSDNPVQDLPEEIQAQYIEPQEILAADFEDQGLRQDLNADVDDFDRVAIRLAESEMTITGKEFIEGMQNFRFGKKTRFKLIGKMDDFVRLGDSPIYRKYRPDDVTDNDLTAMKKSRQISPITITMRRITTWGIALLSSLMGNRLIGGAVGIGIGFFAGFVIGGIISNIVFPGPKQ